MDISEIDKDKLPYLIRIYQNISDFFVDFFGALIQ